MDHSQHQANTQSFTRKWTPKSHAPHQGAKAAIMTISSLDYPSLKYQKLSMKKLKGYWESGSRTSWILLRTK